MSYRILWVDDQIEELRSHILYLSERGYRVDGVSNGRDALKMIADNEYDAVLLDEMMPGLGGLETLAELKKDQDTLPVIMITKSEEENLMDRAIGQRISDYLVKPVSPLQIISALKKLLEGKRIVGEQVTRDFTSTYMETANRINTAKSPGDWTSLYIDLVNRELDLFKFSEPGLRSTHQDQVYEANVEFSKFVRENYESWVNGAGDRPTLSPELFGKWVAPQLETGKQVFWIVIDCMRLDQWRFVEDLLDPLYSMERHHYWSILPSATPFARNAIFSGLYPREIAEQYPDWWLGSSKQQHSKNSHEAELLQELLVRMKMDDRVNSRYFKVFDARDTDNLRKQIGSLEGFNLVAGVYNFLDIMAHGRSQSSIIKELAPDEAAFRSLMRSWFEHSSLWEVLEILARRDVTVLLTTDHGSIHCEKPTTIKCNRDTSTNVRYKYGDNLSVVDKDVFLIKDPERYRLPRQSPIENYAITTSNFFLVYPTNYHEYERLYRDSFQHGGISMQEMIVPFVVLKPRLFQ